MSTVRSFMRSYAAAQRRSQRIQNANTREAQRQYQAQEKANTLRTNHDVVKRYNEVVYNLTAMHREAVDIINWKEVLEEPEPAVPQRLYAAQQLAQDALHLYTPSLFDKLFAQQKKKVNRLNAALREAANKDEHAYHMAIQTYTTEKTEWQTMQLLAKGILAQDTGSYRDAVNKLIPFASLPIGKNLNISFDPLHITIDLLLNTDEVVPDTIYSLTSTGKLSEKKMPASKRNDYYQDHVCSSMLRAAVETIAVLPVQFVIVNGLLEMLNTSTGKMEEQVIASAAFVPETMEKLNLQTIDPSDAFKNFIHHMRFSKINGFQAVDRIDAKTLLITTH